MRYTIETKINNLNYIDDRSIEPQDFNPNEADLINCVNYSALGSIQDASYETSITIYNTSGLDEEIFKLTLNSTIFEMTDIIQAIFQNFDGRIVNADFSYVTLQDSLEKNRKDYNNPPKSTKVFDPIVKANYGTSTNIYGEIITSMFNAAIFKDLIIKNVAFYSCIFTNANFYNVTFENCKFINCTFIQSTFNYVSFYNSVFDKDCEFLLSRWNICTFDLYRSLNGEDVCDNGTTIRKNILLYPNKNNLTNHWDDVTITACDFHYPTIDEKGNIVFETISLDEYIGSYIQKDN